MRNNPNNYFFSLVFLRIFFRMTWRNVMRQKASLILAHLWHHAYRPQSQLSTNETTLGWSKSYSSLNVLVLIFLQFLCQIAILLQKLSNFLISLLLTVGIEDAVWLINMTTSVLGHTSHCLVVYISCIALVSHHSFWLFVVRGYEWERFR